MSLVSKNFQILESRTKLTWNANQRQTCCFFQSLRVSHFFKFWKKKFENIVLVAGNDLDFDPSATPSVDVNKDTSFKSTMRPVGLNL